MSNLPRASSPCRARKPPGDQDMVTTLATRLKTVERENNVHVSAVARLERENASLRTQVATLAKQRELAEDPAAADVEQLRKQELLQEKSERLEQVQREKAALDTQVAEMTKFLEDYGLQWVGGGAHVGNFKKDACARDVDAAAAQKPKYGGEDGGRPKQAWTVNMNQITARIMELNSVAEKDAKIIRKGGMARFSAQAPVLIAIWKDGIQVQGHPFWVYGSKSADRVLTDLTEAYFPYCLKDAYPDGVPLKAVDKSLEPYKEDTAQGIFFTGCSNAPSSQGQFLSKLSERKVVDGQVIEVRQGVQDILAPVGAEVKADEISCPPCGGGPVRLQVRMELGQVLVVRCDEECSVGHLIAAVNDTRRKRQLPSIGKARVICSNFPARTYDDPAETMVSAGLAPNAALFVRPRTQEPAAE